MNVVNYYTNVYNEENRLTNFALGTMFIRNQLLDEDTVIQEDDRLPILTALINEVKNLNVNDIDGGNAENAYSDNGGGA